MQNVPADSWASYSAADFNRQDGLPNYKAFVSYRGGDAELAAQWIASRLNQALGPTTAFIAPGSITLGYNFNECIHDALNRSRVLIAVIGNQWSTQADERNRKRLDNPNDWVRREVLVGLDRGIPVVPLMVEGAAVPTHEVLPPELRALTHCQGLFLRSDHFDRDLDGVLGTVAPLVDKG